MIRIFKLFYFLKLISSPSILVRSSRFFPFLPMMANLNFFISNEPMSGFVKDNEMIAIYQYEYI